MQSINENVVSRMIYCIELIIKYFLFVLLIPTSFLSRKLSLHGRLDVVKDLLVLLELPQVIQQGEPEPSGRAICNFIRHMLRDNCIKFLNKTNRVKGKILPYISESIHGDLDVWIVYHLSNNALKLKILRKITKLFPWRRKKNKTADCRKESTFLGFDSFSFDSILKEALGHPGHL